MRFLKTNTATRVTVGPFIDKTDGFTPEVALTVTSEKLTLVVDDGGVPTLVLDVAPTASAGNNDMVHITNEDSGYYDLELTAANLNYVGRAVLSLNDVATHLPVFHEFMILSAQAYDAMFGTGNFSADVKAINAIASTSVTTVSAYQGTTQPINFNGTGATAYSKVDVTQIATAAVSATTAQLGVNVVNIANAVVNTATAQIGANVVSQANIDFGAAQKTSLNAATPASVQNIAATGTGLTAIPWNASWDAEVQSEVNDALVANNLDHLALTTTAAADMTTEVADGTILSRIIGNGDTSTFVPSTDGLHQAAVDTAAVKVDTAAILVDTGTTLDGRIPAALVSGRMDSSVGAVANDAITAASIAAGAIDNATFAADVGSTAFATNIIGLAVFKALDSAITDAVSLTAGGLLEKVRKLSWVLCNKITVTDANGNTVVYKDDNSTAAYSVNAALTDDSTTTTRLRMA